MTREVCIIYSCHGTESIHHQIGENNIWMSSSRSNRMPNIAMGSYSLRNPNPEDSILVIEPICAQEPDYYVDFLSKFRYVFTWAVRAFENLPIKDKVIEVNHPTCKGIAGKDEIAKNWTKSWGERRSELTIIANRKGSGHPSSIYELRTMLGDELNKTFNVSWYGHDKINKPYYKSSVPSKATVLGAVQFSICPENCYDEIYSHGYFTEKMAETWINGAVPIYMGCYNIDDFGFPPESYIDLRKYVVKNNKNLNVNYPELIDKIKSFTEQDYQIAKQAFLDNIDKFYHAISYDRIYGKFLDYLA